MSKKSKNQQIIEPINSAQSKQQQIEIPLILSKKYLSNEDVNKLENLTPEKIENYLAHLFNLTDYEIELRDACFLDYYVTHYWWAAKIKHFNKEQIITYFSIAYLLMDSLREKHSKLFENIETFKSILCELNDKLKLFSDDQVKEIINHLSLTFFQNHKIFEFVINERQPEVYITRQIEVECPKPVEKLYPPPLDEAIPEPYYNKYILKIPDPLSAEELARLESEKPENMILSQQVIDEIHSRFGDLSIEEAKRIIYDVTNEVVAGLKNEMKTKIKDKETALINELAKNTQKKTKK